MARRLEPFRPRRAPERLVLGLPIEPAGRGPRAAPLRPPSTGRRAHRPARRARAGGIAGTAASRPGPRVRPRRDTGRAGCRAALPRADRGRRGDRTPPVRAARADPAAGGGRASRAGARRHGPGGRSATPVVHAAGRPWRPARLAARAAGPDLRGGSGPAGGHHRSGGATARDALGVATGRLGRTGSGLVTRLLRDHPAIEVELDAAGRLRGDPLERPARDGRGLQPLAGRGGLVARADRAGLLQGRRAIAGWRSSISTGSTGHGTSSGCTTETPLRPTVRPSASGRTQHQRDDEEDRGTSPRRA